MTILGIDPGAHGASPCTTKAATSSRCTTCHQPDVLILRQAAAASIHHRMPLTSAADNPDNHYPDYISDNPERDVTSIAVEVGGVVHLGHYSTRNGVIRVTYGSLCKATQLAGMENPEGIG
jgi:hypothetical protein